MKPSKAAGGNPAFTAAIRLTAEGVGAAVRGTEVRLAVGAAAGRVAVAEGAGSVPPVGRGVRLAGAAVAGVGGAVSVGGVHVGTDRHDTRAMSISKEMVRTNSSR